MNAAHEKALRPRGLTPRNRRIAYGAAITVVALALVANLIGSTPWPSALVIRQVFAQGSAKTVAELNRHQPPPGRVDARTGVRYRPGDSAATLDVFTPAGISAPAPVIVWVHGGAWISGSSDDVDPYLRILADKGYVTVGVNYSLGPDRVYPEAVEQVNSALGFVSEHAAELHIDPQRIVLAGDSAGAQLASQLATLTTNPEYAHLLGIAPALRPDQLAATILHCGVYDMDALADLTGINAWGFRVALWAYTGTKQWSQTSVGSTMSTIKHVTPAFPPTFISGGNGDGLTWMESVPMARALAQQGVPVTELFWSADHRPALLHEYQFRLDSAEAQQALEATLAFLDRTVGGERG
ncbi:alpha/beta hydrolase [Leifsonia aquatica]|uniref:alpha/beta hydrolase n=1 Tax=Leifsonia aquatica TaxID=144185 RepID=UPI0028B094F4|nr:alpha/beta hydrolase [Leifsonia aquatica]